MLNLFPELNPFNEFMLDVGDGHSLHVEQSGNPAGIPVLFIHGGPGGGCSPEHRRFFDPSKYRIILFDQRGSGRSLPHASLQHNSTSLLIEDMENIRLALKIDKWLLFGGSWGSTLALLYAQAYPERVRGMILRGIFLCRQQDIDWLYEQGASAIFPDYWQDFVAEIDLSQRDQMVKAYYERLTSDNEIARMSAAKAWSVWEGRCSTLNPYPDAVNHYSDPHLALAMARIESHYFINQGFIEENQILNNAGKIEDIPTVIVHGRYDMVCPVQQAFDLYNALPNSELSIIRDAGHSSFEPGITDCLVRATNNFSLSLA